MEPVEAEPEEEKVETLTPKKEALRKRT